MEVLFIDFLQLSTGSFAAESFGTLSHLQFCSKGNTSICQFIIWLKVIVGNKKTSRRHSSKFAQPQNLEKERKLNIFFNISLDLEDLCGTPFYFLAGYRCCFCFLFFFLVICGGEISLSKISQFQKWLNFIDRYFDISIWTFFNTVALRILSKISPVIVWTRWWSNSTLVPSTVLRFCGALKETKRKINGLNVVQELTLFCRSDV